MISNNAGLNRGTFITAPFYDALTDEVLGSIALQNSDFYVSSICDLVCACCLYLITEFTIFNFQVLNGASAEYLTQSFGTFIFNDAATSSFIYQINFFSNTPNIFQNGDKMSMTTFSGSGNFTGYILQVVVNVVGTLRNVQVFQVLWWIH